jgi:SAM-dependent methyltransferase
MPATERLLREREFHDRQARDRARTFARQPHRLHFADAEYLDHETWIRPAFARLGDVRDKRVLDWGCGHGMAAVVLARRGADVTACDLSAGYVAEARARARANGVAVRCLVADAERLPFATQSFDAVWGHAILHHLDVSLAARELRRMLRPGGVAVLCEPWGGNPLLRLARRWFSRHTPDEEPLGPAGIRQLTSVFEHVEVEGRQLLSILRPAVPRSGLREALLRHDERLLGRCPRLQRYCRYVVITLRRNGLPCGISPEGAVVNSQGRSAAKPLETRRRN